MVIVDKNVGCAGDVERDDEQPEQRTYPDRCQRQHGQYAGGEVAIGGKAREADRQIGPDRAGHDEHQSEYPEAVQGRDRAMRFDPIHRLEPRQDVDAEAKQPGDITEYELGSEHGFDGHLDLLLKCWWTSPRTRRPECRAGPPGGFVRDWLRAERNPAPLPHRDSAKVAAPPHATG